MGRKEGRKGRLDGWINGWSDGGSLMPPGGRSGSWENWTASADVMEYLMVSIPVVDTHGWWGNAWLKDKADSCGGMEGGYGT